MTISASAEDFDWASAWIEHQGKRRPPHDAAHWDKRAYRYSLKSASDYAVEFLALADIRPGESVFDMGCGWGTLTIPLATAGHEVLAVDFSPAMLEGLNEELAERGLSKARTVQASWTDDWDAAGIVPMDVAVASRSIIVEDLRGALEKLERYAKRKVCVTVATAGSPRFDHTLYEAVGRSRDATPDHIYCVNILLQMGRFPELRYIVSSRDTEFASYEKACDDMAASLGEVLPEERERFDAFCKAHIKERENAAGETVWHKDYRQLVRWAFISWDVNSEA